jgi:UDP-N-acetylglucosamine diphosphorylase / glucose-1-phosphate thymidylyltransferase / UDP-N-acetylgalactosamine diphosphorylase / glucosamine-1-phosphate N-acetyltransferase / galactosamine-1-phosphate N-acetyltransferase
MIKDFISTVIKEIDFSIDAWFILNDITAIIDDIISKGILLSEYKIENNIAIHESATIEKGVTLKGPIVIGKGCFIGAHAYLRGGVFLDHNVSIGPSCEIKSSIIHSGSSIAHFNFIGNSIIGHHVNFEAGSITANYHNDKNDKRIFVKINDEIIETGVNKFGALVGDGCKIGANAVLSPGTILNPNTIIKRLALVEQV